MFKKKFLSVSFFLSGILFTSCEFFNPDLQGFLKEYTESAAIERIEYSLPVQKDKAGNLCVASSDDLTCTLYMRNPQDYSLVMNYYKNADEINYDDIFCIVAQDPGDKKKAYFNLSKLQLEQCEKDDTRDITGFITINHPETGRDFNQFPISLFVNSPPPSVEKPMLQLTSESDGQYALCFYMPVVEDTVHENDTFVIQINDKTRYFDKAGTGFYKDPEMTIPDADFLSTPPDLYPLQADMPLFKNTSKPDGELDYKKCYFLTNDNCSEDEKTYDITILDTAGFEAKAGVSNKPYKLDEVTFNIEENSIVPSDEESGTFALEFIHSGMAGDKFCGEVEVVYTIKQDGVIYKTGTLKVSDTESGVVQLPPGKDYEVTAYAKKNYFISSDSSYKGNFNISRSTNYYVSADGRYEALGTKKDPYKDFYTCVETIKNQISDYGEAAEYNIYVMSDFSVSDTDVILYLENETGAFNLNIIGYGSKRTMTCSENAISFIFLEWEKSVKIQNIKFTGNTAIIVKENYPGRSTVNLTLSDVEISGCRNNDPSSPVPPVIFTSSGILTIEDSTITQNTILANKENYYDGFTCISIDRCLNPPEIKGKVVIYDNFKVNSEDETQKCPANLNLLNNDLNQIPVKLIGSLSEGSKIGITTWDVPITGITVPFTTGFATYHPGEAASKYFVGDVFTVITENGEGVLAVGGGLISKEFYDDVKFEIDRTSVFYDFPEDSWRTINVKAKLDGEEITLSSINLKLLNRGDFVKESGTSTIVVDRDFLFDDTYVLQVEGVYKGTTYRGNFDISYTKGDNFLTLTAPPTSGSYNIGSVESFVKFGNMVNSGATFDNVELYLMKNIVLPENFVMIGGEGQTASNRFRGVFDGNNHKITVTGLAEGSTSIFGLVTASGTVIRNLIVEGNVTATGDFYGLCNYVNSSARIENCINRCSITTTNGKAAGISGGGNNSAVFVNCRNEADISGTGIAGGIVAECSNAKFDGCVNTGNITTTGDAAGGIAGKLYGSIVNCINTGTITARINAGGICGYSYTHPDNKDGIVNCYNSGSVIATFCYAGGILGNAGSTSTNYDYALVKNCFNTGSVTAENQNTVFGIIGNVASGIKTSSQHAMFENNYYLRECVPEGQSGCAGILDSTGKFSASANIDAAVTSLNSWIGTNSTFKSYTLKQWRLVDGTIVLGE